MKHSFSLAAAAAQCLIFSFPGLAQAPAPAGRGGRGYPPPQPPSYEVRADRTVVFRLRAPDATSVKLNGDFLTAPPAVEGAPPAPAAAEMTKGGDGF